MPSEIKLTISQNDKIIETVIRPVDRQNLLSGLEQFQTEANAAITKMIEASGDSPTGDYINMDDDDDDDEEDDNDDSLSGNQEKKGHSKSKKKKHH